MAWIGEGRSAPLRRGCKMAAFRRVLLVSALVFAAGRAGAETLSLKATGGVEVTLSGAVTGDNYSVEYTTNLAAPGRWLTFTNGPLDGSSNTWTDTAADLKSARFYRAAPAPLQGYNPPTSTPATPHIFTTNDVLGAYQRSPVQNSWHLGSIIRKPGSSSLLQWTNQAGVTWNLTPGFADQLLRTDGTNPYQNTAGGRDFALKSSGDSLLGFTFDGEFFGKIGAQTPTIASASMHGYVSTFFTSTAPVSYRYGFSFYTAVWPLLDGPLAGFQVGLPGTWVIPDNTDFFQPLLPPDNPMRMGTPNLASDYWRSVFQTIEGSAGTWESTQFPATAPKYRMNGSIDGYIHEVSSPGWGFGQTTSLPTNAMGLAQLSNRLLVPPDGLTFDGTPGGEFLGYAWMALPLIPPADRIGDQSWTCFVSASNYKGVLAFYVPQLWTRYSETYTNIIGRGLDARPGIVYPLAMEFGATPMTVQTNGAGKVYARIPRLLFPTNGTGATYLAADMTLYSKSALFTPVQAWFAGGASVTARFNDQGGYRPSIGVNPIGFSAGSGNLAVSGFGGSVQAAALTTPGGGHAFGLKWTGAGPAGVFPEYFVLTNNTYTAIPGNALPADVVLPGLDFAAAGAGGPYTSPSFWSTPPPSSATNVVTLSDGSKVSYAWYRFVDQPAVQAFLWSPAQRDLIQARIEQIHAHWSTTDNFMQPPTGGVLATLDPALLVTPPPGMEIGYVPIVLGQWKP